MTDDYEKTYNTFNEVAQKAMNRFYLACLDKTRDEMSKIKVTDEMKQRKIIESPYGEHPDNFHIARESDTLIVELTYPPWTDADNKNGQVRHIFINQEAVRSSDGIRVHLCWVCLVVVVEQPKYKMVEKVGYSEEMIEWAETGFFQSWAFGSPGDEA